MALGAAAVGVIAVLVFVDLSPRVQGDFFFAYDDPQMQAVREVADAFPGGAQLILRVTVPSEDVAGHRKEIGELTDDLLAVDGVEEDSVLRPPIPRTVHCSSGSFELRIRVRPISYCRSTERILSYCCPESKQLSIHMSRTNSAL